MADIELVIKIPEELYKQQLGSDWVGNILIHDAIANGKPLPKGHGDLIDVDDIRIIELDDGLHIIRHEKGDEIDAYIDSPTIIEADTESDVINSRLAIEASQRVFCEEEDIAKAFQLGMAFGFAEKCDEMLDKIRAEIEQNAYPIVHGVNNCEKGITLYGILQVIDKYKSERSDKEC